MATHGILYIKSNDGTADAGMLAIYNASGASLITVTATGATSDFSGADAYTYDGSKEFLGFAEVANATEPTYAIGDTFYASGEGTVYIVEAEPTTTAVTVEYNGSVVATIENGNKATLPIKDLKMKTDIVITVPEAEVAADSPLPIEVSTEAEMTALLTSGEVGGVYKYTGTTGTYENGALYVLEEEASLISFTIDGTSYQAEEGMTWGEWVESEYNTDGFIIFNSIYVGNDSYVIEVDTEDYAVVEEYIIEGYAYNLASRIGMAPGGGDVDPDPV